MLSLLVHIKPARGGSHVVAFITLEADALMGALDVGPTSRVRQLINLIYATMQLTNKKL